MRTFSQLRWHCSHPEVLPPGDNLYRDKAAARGVILHNYMRDRVERGVVLGPNEYFEQESFRNWARGLDKWLSSLSHLDIETEVAMGLRRNKDRAMYEPVTEVEPHVYIPNTSVPRWERFIEDRPVILAQVEQELCTAGRADLMWKDKFLSHVCDVKTGARYLGPPDKILQVLAQGIAATLRDETSGFVPGIYYARTGSVEWSPAISQWSPEWDRAWHAVFEAAALDTQARPGGWCLSCYSRQRCPSDPEGGRRFPG